MPTTEPRSADYDAGDRVWRWWDSGTFGSDPQPLTVVRVNRKTLTVRTDRGAQFRLPFDQVEGHWSDEDQCPIPPEGQRP